MVACADEQTREQRPCGIGGIHGGVVQARGKRAVFWCIAHAQYLQGRHDDGDGAEQEKRHISKKHRLGHDEHIKQPHDQ